MKVLLGRICLDIWDKFRGKSLLLIILMILNALTEGLVLALILPLLHLAGIGGEKYESSPISLHIKSVFDSLGLSFEIQFLLLFIIFVALLQHVIFLTQS